MQEIIIAHCSKYFCYERQRSNEKLSHYKLGICFLISSAFIKVNMAFVTEQLELELC